jgi:hypothetical protein
MVHRPMLKTNILEAARVGNPKARKSSEMAHDRFIYCAVSALQGVERGVRHLKARYARSAMMPTTKSGIRLTVQVNCTLVRRMRPRNNTSPLCHSSTLPGTFFIAALNRDEVSGGC